MLRAAPIRYPTAGARAYFQALGDECVAAAAPPPPPQQQQEAATKEDDVPPSKRAPMTLRPQGTTRVLG